MTTEMRYRCDGLRYRRYWRERYRNSGGLIDGEYRAAVERVSNDPLDRFSERFEETRFEQ